MAWQIKYQNVSSKKLNITGFGGVTEAVVGEINHQPASTLDIGGSDYLSMDPNAMKFIANGDADFYQGIGVSGNYLWVRVHVPFQMLGIGTSPYWYYLVNNGADPTLDSKSWKKHDSDSVSIDFAGFTAKLSPTKDHTSITLSVTIDDKA